MSARAAMGAEPGSGLAAPNRFPSAHILCDYATHKLPPRAGLHAPNIAGVPSYPADRYERYRHRRGESLSDNARRLSLVVGSVGRCERG
jgi:hypothetical protein